MPTYKVEHTPFENPELNPGAQKIAGQVNILLINSRKQFCADFRTATREYPKLSMAKLSMVRQPEAGDHWAKLVPHVNLHILLFDLDYPVSEGRVWTRWMAKNFPQVSIIALANSTSPGMAPYLYKQGFDGVIGKNGSSDEMMEQILSIHKGNGPFKQLKSTYPRIERTTKAFHKRLEWLNSTELEILRLVCLDYTAAEIAQHLPYSPRSIEGKKAKIQSKLGVRGVAGMVAHAVNNGLLYEEPTQTFR